MKKRVLVAVSGGVDSTYAMCKLLEDGYDVVAITFKICNNNNSFSTIEDAKSICDKLKVKHIVEDYTEEFNKSVLNYFINSYKAGLTPNPCVMCNKHIKFGVMYESMIKYNCDYLATGHYIRLDKEFNLIKSLEKNKDQTYFVAQVEKKFFRRCIFPLGSIKNKDDVRKYLEKKGFKDFNKKDSQEICFIENNDYISFLREYIPDKKGIIVDDDNKILGYHNGVFNFTIGQRKRLNINSNKRLFVTNINSNDNSITVSDEDKLYSNIVKIKNINILNEKYLNKNLKCKIRYSSIDIDIDSILKDNNIYTIKLKEKQKNISPGQYVVAYFNDYVVFSGEIISG